MVEISAEKLPLVLDGKKADVIISRIPFFMIKKSVREKILSEIKANLEDTGRFIQFQYSLDLQKLLNKTFENNVDITFVSLNVPPAFVYTCTMK